MLSSMMLPLGFETLARRCEFASLVAWVDAVRSSAQTIREEANNVRASAVLLRAETRRMREESGRAVSRSSIARTARRERSAAPVPDRSKTRSAALPFLPALQSIRNKLDDGALPVDAPKIRARLGTGDKCDGSDEPIYPAQVQCEMHRAPRGHDMDTPADIVSCLLRDASGEAICDSCLTLECGTTLTETRKITKALLTRDTFQLGSTCSRCQRTAPAIIYVAKCAHCHRPVEVIDKDIVLVGDFLHEACLVGLITDDTIRISSKMTDRSRELIEQSRRRMRERQG